MAALQKVITLRRERERREVSTALQAVITRGRKREGDVRCRQNYMM